MLVGRITLGHIKPVDGLQGTAGDTKLMEGSRLDRLQAHKQCRLRLERSLLEVGECQLFEIIGASHHVNHYSTHWRSLSSCLAIRYDTTMSDIFFLVLGAGCVWLYLWWTKPRKKPGQLDITGTQYQYVIGDNLSDSEIRLYRGMEITLPKFLPHIYLDAHTNDKMFGPRYTFPRNYQISLEGDFDAYFQMYALPAYKSVALSVITPDVMSTLMDHSVHFDVEIDGNKLRIISNKRVYDRHDREAQLLAAAQLVLPEITHRLRSWQPSDELESGNRYMPLTHNQTIKFGRYGISSASLFLGVLLGTIGLGTAVAGIMMFSDPALGDATSGWILIGLGVFFFPITWLYLIVGERRGWLWWLKHSE